MKRALIAVLLLCSFAYGQVPAPTNQPLTIENIFAEGGITGRGPETIKWSPDATKVSFVQRDDSGQHGALWYIDATNGNKAVLVSEQKLQSLAPPASSIKDERQKEWATRYNVAAYQWAPDSKHLLFDSRGQLWIFSLDTGTGVQITAAPDPSSDPKFSPDGKRIAYLRKHDLYVRPTSEGSETRLTSNNDDDNLLNGEVDWVYAEELAVRSNYFWSPDGKQIAFLQMNEKDVPEYPITDWMPQHPKVEQEKYPKAGDPNPTVRIGVINSGGGGVKWIKLGKAEDTDFYIPRFGWIRPGFLWVEVLNRNQDKLDLYFVETSNGRSRRVLSETSDAWVNVNDDFKVLKSGDQFLWSSWRDGYTHIYVYGFNQNDPLGADAKLVRQLTSGVADDGDVKAVDDASGEVYFTGHAADPRQVQVYSVKLEGGPVQRVTSEAGAHSPTFSEDAKYFVDNFSATMTPPRLSFCKVGGTCTPVWESRGIATYDLVEPKQLELKAADGTTTLYGSLLLPPNAAAAHSVPLILDPYGGPSGQSVRDAWGGTTFLFHEIMVRRGFAILIVDNRGMANRGKVFAMASRHKFGEVELADQLAAMDQVLQQFPQLDPNRLGWWGWSYGGYMTLYALTHSDRFTAGVSVAPVTNWLLYDSIYTERYMGLPKDNEAGYKNSSPVNAAKNLHGHILEVHGTSDDNVHVQNTIQMIEAYIEAGKTYDLQLYPNKTHGIAGQTDRSHLFHRIQQHFERYLMPQEAVGH